MTATNTEKILVVDDEEDILELINYNLSREHYSVQCVTSGEDALGALKKAKPNLVLLDLMLPGMNGLDICRKLKGAPETADVPVIIISAKGEEADVVAGLELGADDYITKPFSPRILLARVRAVLRRHESSPDSEQEIVKIHDLTINVPRHEVFLGETLAVLSATEFKLLLFLARNPGRVFTRSQIVEGVHGDDYPVTDRSVDVQIVGLRKKMGAFENYIETVRGVGYRFKE